MHSQRRWILVRWIAMAVCLCAALAMAWNGLAGSEQRRAVTASQDDPLVHEAEILLRAVQGLDAVHRAPAAPNLDALFAVLVHTHVPTPPSRPAPQPLMHFSVDMIIAKGEQGRAIISGRLTRIGDTLPDGSRVLDIQAEGVTVQLKGKTRRLPAPKGRISAQE